MSQIRRVLRPIARGVVRLRELGRNLYLRSQTPESIFTKFYETNHWNNPESRSGSGSSLNDTRTIARELPDLLRRFDCRSMLDAPCGDFYWMSRVQLDCDYVGGDIVEEMVLRNERDYGLPSRRFIKLDVTRDQIPTSDLILCRDLLVHFSFAHIRSTLQNFAASGSTYLLTTTFVDRKQNANVVTGSWRPINLQSPPFDFPPPLAIIREDCPQEGSLYADKSLALWRLADLPIS